MTPGSAALVSCLSPKMPPNPESWQWIPFLCEEPSTTMERDSQIFRNLATPTLRFYRWASPALSYGRTQGIDQAALDEAQSKGLKAVRRPSGGGKVEHGKDLCFSIFWTKNSRSLPWKVKDSYLSIHTWIQKALSDLGIPTELIHGQGTSDNGWCFQGAVCYDLVSGASKVVGGAQWREKNAALHQGSMQLALSEKNLSAFKKRFEEMFHVFF